MGEENIKDILDRALIGTKINYSSFDLPGTLTFYIISEMQSLIDGRKNNLDISKVIAVVSKKYKVPLRYEVKEYFDNHKNISLYEEILRIATENWSKKQLDKNGKAMLEMSQIYVDILNKLPNLKGEEREKFIEDYRQYYANEDMMYDVIGTIITNYINSIDEKKAFESIVSFNSISDSIYEFMTNIKGINLMDRYSSKLLEGKIQLTTDRGYPDDETKIQQDAILSIAKNDELYLNVVADGVGGSGYGEVASRETIVELKKWFEQLDDKSFDDLDYLIENLKEKINEISKDVKRKYMDCYTTVVLALTVRDKTVIMNVGDSTAYTYDGEVLTELSIKDLAEEANDYETARRGVDNNIIKAAIGVTDNLDPHANVIDNNGQRIILSSDGVTDLLSEETFISFFRDDSTSETIVDDALNHPDLYYKQTDENGTVQMMPIPKTADNISAIVINLPNKKIKKI